MVYGTGNSLDWLAGATMKRLLGFTLVELLISVSLLTTVLGTFFAVLGTVRRSEAFRDSTTKLTTSASYGFEPIVRAIKDSEGLELIHFGGATYCVRGYYLRSVDPARVTDPGELTLTTLSVDVTRQDSQVLRQLVRRDFSLSPTRQLVETTYRMPQGTPTSECQAVTWGDATVTSRVLTDSDLLVRRLNFSGQAPLLKDFLVAGAVRRAPYLTVDLIVDYPGSGRQGIAPMSLYTTVAPPFVYGEKRE